MINIALYKPDIPQNTAAIIRLGACLSLRIHIIEPCGFSLNDSRFKRVAMDYTKLSKISKYKDYDSFKKKNYKSRIILMTTKTPKIELKDYIYIFTSKTLSCTHFIKISIKHFSSISFKVFLFIV